MVKVLIYDDRLGVRNNIEISLTEAFPDMLEISSCKDVYEADEAIDNGNFDVIIVDSMMSTHGLDKDQVKYTKQGLLTGIIWLCLLHNNTPQKLQDAKIYVVSGYMEDCKKAISFLKEYTHNDHFIDDSIELVSKNGDYINYLIKDIKTRFKI